MLAGVDWDASPAGPERSWPQCLRTAQDICFDSRFPIIIFWGPELVQFYNEAYMQILGAKHPKAFGQRAADCFPEIWDQVGPMLHGVLATGTPTWAQDLMLPLERNGFAEECYFTFSYSPLSDENGVSGVFCAVTETTAQVLREREMRERAEALAELDRAKTDFFNNISHEFRTPLTLILGPLDEALGAQRSLDAEETAMLRRNARRLLRLVNTLLDFSRIDAHRAALARSAVDLPALTVDLASTFRSAFAAAGVAFDIDAPPLDAAVAVDARMWEHVVLNLLSNALKFTLRGRVTLSLRREGDVVRLTVSDEGCGMSPAEAARAFERFWRGNGRPARTHEGSGIGLALVAEIARLHGGSARLDSIEGRGTTVVVEIPYEPAAPAAEALEAGSAADLILAETGAWHGAPSQTHAATDKPRVLLVEDNADLRDYISRLLAPSYAVTQAADAASALSLAVESPPDLVLSDVMMPGIDGTELVRRLRAEEQTRTVPIVLLSARADEAASNEGILAGADDYLVKPFVGSQLLVRLERLLSRAQVRAEETARFRRIADEIPMLIWTQSSSDHLEWINKRWFEYTGLSEAYSSNDARLAELVPADDMERFRAIRDAHEPAGEPYEFEVRVRSADGVYRRHLGRLVPIKDEDGKIVRWAGSATDIHDRQTLAEARERELRALAEAIPQIVWRATPEGVNDYFNSRWSEYTGQDSEVVQERFFECVHPDDREAAYARWGQSVATGRHYSDEFRLRAADGSYRWFVARAVPERNEAGKVVRWFGTTTDVDDLKRAQEELRFSEHRYRTLIETTTEGVWVVDSADRTTFVNARMAQMLGYSPEEMLGRRVWEFVGDGREAAEAGKARVLETGASEGEMRLQRRDGTDIWVLISSSVLLDDAGSFAGALGMVHDITARKRTETTRHLLGEASGALAQSLGLRQTIDKLLDVFVPTLATWAVIELHDEESQPHGASSVRRFAGRHADPSREAEARFGPDDAPAADGCIVAVPLTLQGRRLGAITIAAENGTFDEGDVALFAEIASRAAVALEHARLYDRERRVAVTLQDAALPKKLPSVPGLTFSAVYQAASSEALVGGDWYDAFRLSDGRMVLSIGDVMGSGLDAAVTMGAVRQAIRGAAQIYPDPVGVLNAADRALRSEQPDRIVTAFVGLLDPLTLTFTYASAGHPPPLLRADDGTITELGGSGLPLGLRDAGRSNETSRFLTLGDQSLLVLYTDGLTESTRDVFEGERLLRAALNDPAVLDSRESAAAIRDAVTDQAHDDVAILAVRVDDVRRRLTRFGDVDASSAHWTFDAFDAAAARSVRLQIASALRSTGAGEGDVCNAELLFTELVGNVIRHTSGSVEVALDLTGEEPVLHVIDRGPGFTFHARLPNDVMSESGRGLYIAAALASELSVLPRKDGGSHARAVLSFRPRSKHARIAH
jgi:PAS domain S-box-containing protein